MLDIAEVAERSGLGPSALRFYEKRGLLTSAGRNGLRRVYEPAVLDRLALIACARMAEKAKALDDIARLTRMRNSLRHAFTCDHEPLVECPDFKREFTAKELT